MFLQNQHEAAFAAFDVYPSAKGSATHIFHNAETLFEQMNEGWLAVLGNEKLSPYQQEGKIEITRFDEPIANYLERGQAFSDYLYFLLKTQKQLKIAHFRDIWSGMPFILYQKKYNFSFHTVFEINGLTSIELPYRYPKISRETLEKIRLREQYCYQHADAILTPSEVIRKNLVNLGVQPSKITVITNGADVPETFERPAEAPEKYGVYFGALQPWQGIEVLLKAMTYLQDLEDFKLVICASNKEKYTKGLKKMVERLNLNDKIIWQYQLSKKDLYAWVHFAALSFAPLTECSRNLEQGCCPLKVLESMAVGTMVVASDIPAVREIITDEKLGKLVRADRPAELARAIRLLLAYPDYRQEIVINAQKHILQGYTWEQKRRELAEFYHRLLQQHTQEKSL